MWSPDPTSGLQMFTILMKRLLKGLILVYLAISQEWACFLHTTNGSIANDFPSNFFGTALARRYPVISNRCQYCHR